MNGIQLGVLDARNALASRHFGDAATDAGILAMQKVGSSPIQRSGPIRTSGSSMFGSMT
jgi:hypothetical protein